MYLGSDEGALDAEVVSATYTASVGGGDGFSIGNACSAELSIVLAEAGLVAGGQTIRVAWDAAGTEYPLFVGKVSKATVSGSQTTITAYDALDGVSATPYQPTLTGSCTAAAALADIAEQIGVELDSATQTLAEGVALTEGVGALEGLSLSSAAANLALLLGGNAVITREGALAVRQFADSGWAAESYSGGASPEDTAYTVEGLTFQRTDTTTAVNEDGTSTETSTTTDYTAASGSGGGLTYSSSLATQALVDGAFAALEGLTFWAGSFSTQGGIFVEPGDLAEIDGQTVAVSSLTLSLDGGCKADITSLGQTETTGSGGTLTQAISAMQQDYGEFKSLVAQNVSVTNANITNLQATAAQMETAIIGKAEVSDLTAANAAITDLSAEFADISSLLAGNVGAGTVQAIHLTADNVVIDDVIITDAMIADLSASKLTAGTIYTSLIRIANDTGENFLIDGATLQIKDANGTYRIQMGEDGDGNYSYYLWDAEGNLIFDALGAYVLHNSIIKDVNVANDANINQSKIDMASVAERLNTDGSITVNAASVTIDDTTLDYKLSSMTTATAEAQAAADAAAEVAAALEAEAVADLTQYYSVGDSAAEPPSAPADGVTRAAALADTAVADESRVGIADGTSDWSTDWQTASDGLYLWTAFFVAYADGAAEWTTPTCLSDSAARDSISALETELEVVQGQITAKVWQTDIDEAADALNGSLTTLQDRYSAITQTVDGMTTEVADLTTVVSDNYTALQSKITTVEQTVGGITTAVADLTTVVGDNYTSLESKISTVEQTAAGLTSRVSQTESDISDNTASITTLSSELTQLADSIALCVTTDTDTGYLRLGAGDDGTVKFTIEADNLTLDESGNLAMTGNLTVMDTITMSSDTACITGPSRVYIKSIVYGESGFVVPNSDGTDGHGYYAKDADGSNICLLRLNDSNILSIGNSSYSTRIYGSSIYVNGYATKHIVSIQSVSVSTSGTVDNGSSGSATGTFTAVSGASYLLLPQRANYGYVTEVSYSGTTVTATIYNASGSAHTLAGSVVVIAYV
ncbi:MAG: hypothetical protein LUG55_09170 [Clostridiales bacterium]|nr:hypothetical protein [Clostridiales bacterium]